MKKKEISTLSLRKKILFSLIAISSTLIIAIAVSELFFSFLLGDEYHPFELKLDRELGYVFYPNQSFNQMSYAFLQKNGVIFKYYFKVKINSDGFRGEEFNLAKSDGLRIMCLGDSSTYGWGEDDEYIYPARLENILDKTQNSQVFNFGVHGYSTVQGKIILKKWLDRVKPGVVTLSFGANDKNDISQKRGGIWPNVPDAELFAKPIDFNFRGRILTDIVFNPLWRRLTRRSRTVYWALTRFLFFHPGDPEKYAGIARVSLRDFRQNLEDMIDTIRSRGAAAIIVLFCVEDDYYIEGAKKVAVEKNVPVVSLNDLLEKIKPDEHPREYSIIAKRYGGRFIAENKEFLSTNDYCHPNPLGHLVVAEEIAGLVEQIKK